VRRIEAIIRPERLAGVSEALEQGGFHGFTISDVRGHGQSPERVGEWRGQPYEIHVTHKLLIQVFVEDDEVEAVTGAIARGAFTGRVGDGLITVSDVVSVVRIQELSAKQS
jgi:nitrogen regulatory protein PII